MTSWTVLPLAELAARVADALRAAYAGPGPAVLAVDGRSAGGKSTLAGRLVDVMPGAGLIHGDDIAWYDSVIDWDHLFVDGVLAPLRRGQAVAFRPPAWRERGREGAIGLPAGTDPVVLEGVGASRSSLPRHLTLSIWVETPDEVRAEREAARIASGESTLELQRSWAVEEDAHLLRDRPWDRARWVVAGDPSATHEPAHVLVQDRSGTAG